jgi:hypothetical protein
MREDLEYYLGRMDEAYLKYRVDEIKRKTQT